jgi:amino acid transporter
VDEIRRSPLVAAEAAGRLLGQPGVLFVAVTVMVSTFGTLNGTVLTSPRIVFAPADDGLFFRKVAAVHPRFQMPYVSISMAALLGVAFVLVRTVERSADAFVAAIVPFYALAVAAIFVLLRRPDYAPPFRVPLYPLVPLVFIVATAALLLNAILDSSSRRPMFGVIVAGVPLDSLTMGRGSAGSALGSWPPALGSRPMRSQSPRAERSGAQHRREPRARDA